LTNLKNNFEVLQEKHCFKLESDLRCFIPVPLTELSAYYSVAQLVEKKGLGRTKPATLPCNKHKQHTLWGFYYIQAP
jgi:hypothetical protein